MIHGWGHSLISQAMQLAKDANVSNLVLFHHEPDRTDDQLDQILQDCETWMAKNHASCRVRVAKETDCYQIIQSSVLVNEGS